MSVPSPCVNVCRLEPSTGWCEGCGRSIDEIAAWGTMRDADKLNVWRLLPARRERLALLAFGAQPPDAAPPEASP